MYVVQRNLNIKKSNILTNGIIVVIYLERTPAMLDALLYLFINKITFVPIDPSDPLERTLYKISDLKNNSNKVYILTSKKFQKSFMNEFVINIEELTNINQLEQFFKQNEEKTINKNDIAYILYTSGSTGTPKGVKISYKAFNNFMKGICNQVNFSKNKTVICLTTISFDIFMLESIIPLLKGLIVILVDEIEQKNPKLITEIIKSNNVDILQITPSRMKLLLNYDKELSCIKNLKEILIGGEVFPLNLLKMLKTKTNAKIYNVYGPTEATIWITISDLTDKNTIDIGKPLLNNKIYILDEKLKAVENGMCGEICISGSNLAKGYLNKKDLTEEKFTYYEEKRIYRTGDCGRYLKDGNIEFIGRLDNQVKIRGHRIELEEIEGVILQHKNITNTIVNTFYLKNFDSQLLVAFYESDIELSEEEIKEYLLLRLPSYMVPTKYIKVKEFLYTLNGKIDRKKTSETYSKEIFNYNNNKLELTDLMNSKIISIIKENIEPYFLTSINEMSRLDEIGIDSIGFMTIVVSLENKFNFEFENEKLLFDEFKTIKDIVNYVKQKIK